MNFESKFQPKIFGVISDFCLDVDEICTLLGCFSVHFDKYRTIFANKCTVY